MKILITGASGLIGSALSAYLSGKGHLIGELRRGKGDGRKPYWDIDNGVVDLAEFGEPEAIVHLGGQSIADGRWNESKKRLILDSRVNSTELMVKTIGQMTTKPSVFICASAIGFYGNRGEEVMDEQSLHGNDFVSEIAMKWEKASQQASDFGVRVVNIRTGMVLSPNGGALAKMLLPFKLGLGGIIGSGTQHVSWISIDDMIKAIEFLLLQQSAVGPVNLVSPNPVTNRQYTKALGKALGRWTVFPMPAFVARLAFGDMADELLLSSTRVAPTTLLEMGFEFTHEQIDDALTHLLKA